MNKRDINARNHWQSILYNNIKKFGNYFHVAVYDMVGILLVIFAKEELKGRISEVELDSIKCGFANKLGNKGNTIKF